MPPNAPNDDLIRAICALGGMFAVVTPERKIIAATVCADTPPSASVTGEDCFRFFFHREVPCTHCALAEALGTGHPAIRRQPGAPVQNGWVLHQYIYPLPAGDGPRSLVCTALSLPDQTAAMRQAELSRTFLMSLLNNAADAIIAADRGGKIRIYNPAAEQIFGYTATEALGGMDIRRLYPPEGAREVMALLRSTDHGPRGKLDGHTLVVLNKQGRTVPIRLNASIVYEDNCEIATIGFFRDLRAPVRIEPSAEADQAVASSDLESEPSLGETIHALMRALGNYDLKFGDAAVQAGLMTSDQVAKALEKQREIEAKTQIHVPVGRLMIQLGMISETQRDALLALRSPKPEADTPAPVGAPEGDTRPQGETASETTPPPQPEEAADQEQDEAPDDASPSFRLEVSQDRLVVFLHRQSDDPLAGEKILARLAQEGIVEGLCDAQELAAHLEADPAPDQPLAVARGIAPEPGSPAEVRYFFDTDPLRIGTVREDGTIDWKDRGTLPRVESGALLCEVVPGTEGRSGTDVYGQPIPAPRQDFRPPRCGKGVCLDADGRRYLATIDGMVTLGADLVLTVSRTLNIDGDIGLKTGHVDFDGHIEVQGAVQSGFRVYGHSLRAESIYGAEVHIVGDIIVQNGIFDSRIKCSGSLKAGHIHKTIIDLEGDLVVAREIIDSQIETNGRLLIAEGAVMASNISAKRGMTVRDIGSEVARPSHLEIGVDHRLKRQVDQLREHVAVLKKEIQQREAQLPPLQVQVERMDAELGKIAQDQDRLANKLRALEKQIAQTDVNETAHHLEVMHRQRNALVAEQDRAEAAVERLLAEDAQTAGQISDIVGEIETARQTIEQLNDELVQKQNELAAKSGLPVLKAAGTVAAGTIIAGPRAGSTLAEELHRVHIIETKAKDETGQLRWELKIMPLR